MSVQVYRYSSIIQRTPCKIQILIPSHLLVILCSASGREICWTMDMLLHSKWKESLSYLHGVQCRFGNTTLASRVINISFKPYVSRFSPKVSP
ncbi:hypothetical protein DsansV1_C17g0144741 [Dioscorea sansibarensis]